MSDIIIAGRRYDAFNNLWLPAGASLLQPSRLLDEIIWTSEWLPASLLYQQEFNYETVTGGVGVSDIVHSVVPAGELRFYTIVSSVHNDAVSRDAYLRVTGPGGNAHAASQIQLTTNTPLTLNRPIIVPAAHTLRAGLTALGAASTLTLQAFYLRIKWGEPIPRW